MQSRKPRGVKAQEQKNMKKFIVWELWNVNNQYMGFFLENEKDLAIRYANSFNGSVIVKKGYRYTEI